MLNDERYCAFSRATFGLGCCFCSRAIQLGLITLFLFFAFGTISSKLPYLCSSYLLCCACSSNLWSCSSDIDSGQQFHFFFLIHSWERSQQMWVDVGDCCGLRQVRMLAIKKEKVSIRWIVFSFSLFAFQLRWTNSISTCEY